MLEQRSTEKRNGKCYSYSSKQMHREKENKQIPEKYYRICGVNDGMEKHIINQPSDTK